MPIRHFTPLFIAATKLLLGAALLAGCSSQPKNTSLQHAKQAEIAGDYAEIARQYNRLAADAPPAQRQSYKLMMANAFFKGGYINKSRRVLQSIDATLLSGSQKFQRRILLAKIADKDNHPKSVLSHLSISIRDDTPVDMITEYYSLRATAYYKLGNRLAAVHEWIKREPLLQNSEDIENNQQLIWQTLQSLPEKELTITPSTAPDTLSGWLELAHIASKPYKPEQRLNEWLQRYPRHPAANSIFIQLKEQTTAIIERPSQIALLLPLSGAYEKHATALRDGFLTAYYLQQHNDKNEFAANIRIYDTQKDPDAYNRAVNDGAEFIIGPLSKKAVNALIDKTPKTMPVATLILNYSETSENLPDNLYQLGLSPEDEARQVADKAWLDGHSRAIAFIPQNAWGKRVFNAFSKHWQELGGVIAETTTYASKDNDFSEPLRNILNLNESAQRKKQISRLLQRSIKFEPRRRQDVDFVFLAASSRQARLIRPQFKFHYAADLPIYATSRVYGGSPNPAADMDMNDITFCDTPWTLTADKQPSKEYSTATTLWPRQTADRGRMFALGVDAFHIIGELNRLQISPSEYYQGETGLLNMNENNQIHRKLACARFVRGIPQLTETIPLPLHENPSQQ